MSILCTFINLIYKVTWRQLLKVTWHDHIHFGYRRPVIEKLWQTHWFWRYFCKLFCKHFNDAKCLPLSLSSHSHYSYFLIFSSGRSLAFTNITKRSYYIHYKYITWHGGKGSMIAMQIKKDFKVSIFAKHIISLPSPCNGRFESKE